MTVQKVVGRDLIKPNFSLPSGDGSGQMTIRASRAQLHSVPGSGKLTLELYNGTFNAPGLHGEFPNEKLEREIDINPQSAGAETPPQNLSLSEIPASTAKQRELLARLEDRHIARAGFQMFSGDFNNLAGNGWADEEKHLEHQRFRLYRMQTEPPRRWSNGFSCLCFALVGSAMAIRRKNSDVLTSFAFCFFPILIAYYPLMAFGADRAKARAITPYAVWMGDVILAVWGMWLLRRVMRY